LIKKYQQVDGFFLAIKSPFLAMELFLDKVWFVVLIFNMDVSVSGFLNIGLWF